MTTTCMTFPSKSWLLTLKKAEYYAVIVVSCVSMIPNLPSNTTGLLCEPTGFHPNRFGTPPLLFNHQADLSLETLIYPFR